MNQNRLFDLIEIEEILLDEFLKPIVTQSLKKTFDEESLEFLLEDTMISNLYNKKNIVLSFEKLDYVLMDLDEMKAHLLEFTGEKRSMLEKIKKDWEQEAIDAKSENDSYDEESALGLVSIYEKIINAWSSEKQFTRITETV
jgi:hypothetical protein